jgi:hypothetical protein
MPRLRAAPSKAALSPSFPPWALFSAPLARAAAAPAAMPVLTLALAGR